jgi:hypothetical protein
MKRMARPRDFSLDGDTGAIGRTRRIIGLTAARQLNVDTVVLKRKVYRPGFLRSRPTVTCSIR